MLVKLAVNVKPSQLRATIPPPILAVLFSKINIPFIVAGDNNEKPPADALIALLPINTRFERVLVAVYESERRNAPPYLVLSCETVIVLLINLQLVIVETLSKLHALPPLRTVLLIKSVFLIENPVLPEVN